MDIGFLRSLGSATQIAHYLKINGYDQGNIEATLQKIVNVSPEINEESEDLPPETPTTD